MSRCCRCPQHQQSADSDSSADRVVCAVIRPSITPCAPERTLVRDHDGCCVLCGKPGVDAHHRLPRGGGGTVWDPSRFALSRLVWLCRYDHLWVESHRLLAYGLGLLVRRGVTPCSEVPVFHHGRWVLLDDNGGVVPTEADSQGFEVAS